MPLFQFEAMDATGAELRDSLEADNIDDAQQVIRQMGYFVTKIKEVNPYGSPESASSWSCPCLDKVNGAVISVMLSLLSFIAGYFFSLAIHGLK